jgi:hypothetical protein
MRHTDAVASSCNSHSLTLALTLTLTRTLILTLPLPHTLLGVRIGDASGMPVRACPPGPPASVQA